MTARSIVLAAVVAIAGLRADPARADPARAQPDAPSRAQAESHFRQGQAFFQHGDYDRAIGEYQAAFDLSAEPSLIFNIALCYDRTNRPEPALQAFQRYLALAPSGSVADEARNDVARLTPIVEKLVADRAAEDTRRRDDSARQAALREEAARAQARAQAADRRARLSRYVMGAGAAVTAVGATFHVLGWRRHVRLMDEPDNESYVTDSRALPRERHIAYGAYAAGGVTIATGLILALTGPRRDDGPRVSAAITPGGAALVVGWSR